MTTKELAKFKKTLEQELSNVRGALDHHNASHSGTQDRTNVESGDWPQEVSNLEVENHILNNEENYLEKIVGALARIEDGTYGNCENCGAEIPLARLEYKPSVSLCLQCQETKEKKS